MVEETESRDIRKYVGNYNQVADEKNIEMEICFVRPMLAYN
jgi:hypothetical protein